MHARQSVGETGNPCPHRTRAERPQAERQEQRVAQVEAGRPGKGGGRVAAEIAADFMMSFYHVQVGALETQEFRTTPLPFWLICFSDTTKGPLREMYFVVLLPDGTVVQPRVAERFQPGNSSLK